MTAYVGAAIAIYGGLGTGCGDGDAAPATHSGGETMAKAIPRSLEHVVFDRNRDSQ